MKKLICVFTMVALLLGLCACGQAPDVQTEPSAAPTEPTQEATEPQSGGVQELTPEDLYGHIDQNEPVAGVYKIWNKDGVLNIPNHPDAKFQLLCNIDMEGAVLAPIGTEENPFTGEIKGEDFTISNFTVQGGDEKSFGFIGVNRGKLRNLVLDKVTFIPGKNAQNMGSLAGVNENTVIRCTVTNAAMTVDTAPEGAVCGGAVGLNTGSLTNTKVTVDLAYNAPGAATVGGVVGIARGGEVSNTQTLGKLDIAGTNKTAGLFAGLSQNVVIVDSFFLGASNTVDGQLFENFTGNADDDERVTVTGARLRDNGREELDPQIRAVRDKVVKAMYDMGTVQWKVKEDLVYTDRIFSTTYSFQGIPYNHKSSSLAQAMYCIGEDGYLKDWMYGLETSDSWDMYFGSDCSSALQQAWWTVSNSTDIFVCRWMYMNQDQGCIPVGEYKYDVALSGDLPLTEPFILENDEQVIYEAYAAMRAGDAYVYTKESGGHTRMAAEDPVVVRDQDGLIDPQLSYVVSHEQGYAMRDETVMNSTTWRIGWKYYFSNLHYDWAVPVTCEELITGQLEPVEAYVDGGCEGYAGMVSGIVRTNYHLDSVTLKITDSQGNVVLEHPMFTDVQKNKEYGAAYYTGRVMNTQYDLANFALLVAQCNLQPGQTYSYTVTADLATFDHIVVNEDTFTYGS